MVNTLLTGFIENNEKLTKKIYEVCDEIAKLYGRVWVDGAVWINILKSPKVRNAGYKYFMKSFKDRDDAKNPRRQSESNKSIESSSESNSKKD